MESVIALVLSNLVKLGCGALIFLIAYLSNMGLGAWKNISLEAGKFDKKLVLNSLIKYLVLVLSTSGLCIVVTTTPAYIMYIGLEAESEYIDIVNNIISNTAIIGLFITGTYIYAKDGFDKLKALVIKNKK